MTDINKQKFLNELSKLLTFMYEEDRQLALDMYSRAFDNAEDAQALISDLASPTRQAVIIARAYNAKERKLQIHAQSRAEGDIDSQSGEIPGFVQAIQEILPSAVYSETDFVEDGQISLFGENASETVEADAEAVSDSDADNTEAVQEDVPAVSEAEEDVSSAVQAEPSEAVSAEEAVSEAEIDEEKSEAESHKENIVPASPESADEEAVEHLDSIENHQDDQDEEDDDEDDEDEDDEDDDYSYGETVYKANIPLLILFAIFAIPITLLGIAVLLIPTALCLVIACAAIYAGSAILVATFSGFAVFADIMVMLGLALIVLSLGLLFLWMFIWFIGGAMANLVRSVIALGHKWCYKEVSAL